MIWFFLSWMLCFAGLYGSLVLWFKATDTPPTSGAAAVGGALIVCFLISIILLAITIVIEVLW